MRAPRRIPFPLPGVSPPADGEATRRVPSEARLSGRTAFITGGVRGIGLALAEALAEADARVIVADRDPALLEEGSAILAAKGVAAETVLLDVTRPAYV